MDFSEQPLSTTYTVDNTLETLIDESHQIASDCDALWEDRHLRALNTTRNEVIDGT